MSRDHTMLLGGGHVFGGEGWHKVLLSPEATLQEAIRCLDETAMQIVLVVDKAGVLIGSLTDGDIRRGLLRGLSMGSPICDIVHHDAFVVPPHLGRDAVLQLMQTNKVRQLPVVDNERRVVGLHLLDDLLAPCSRDNLVVIMAGGRGTRLRPHTEHCPKPLLPVSGKPILEHIIERANAEGFRRFMIAVHYLGHMIEEYFGDGSRLGVQIEYLREEVPLGTAGALSMLQPQPELPILVSNGDVLTDIRYGELLDFHVRHLAKACMAVRQYEWQHPYGVVHTKGVDIVGFEEKPVSRSHVNAGIYVLAPSILDVLKPGEYCDMPMLFTRLQKRSDRTIVYPMHEPWLDVGRVDDYKLANAGYDDFDVDLGRRDV